MAPRFLLNLKKGRGSSGSERWDIQILNSPPGRYKCVNHLLLKIKAVSRQSVHPAKENISTNSIDLSTSKLLYVWLTLLFRVTYTLIHLSPELRVGGK